MIHDPWKSPPPTYSTHLPGAVLPLTVLSEGRVRYEVAHRDVRLLHAAITTALDRQHHPNRPDFSLIPTALSPSRWALYLPDLPVAQAAVGAAVASRIGQRPVTIQVGPLTRLRAPVVPRSGRHRVEVIVESPVVIHWAGAEECPRDRKLAYPYPVQSAIVSTLALTLGARLGLPIHPSEIALRVLATEAHEAHRAVGHLNGHGTVRGWAGSFTADVSPFGRWLLGCAERIGLGGRTAFGFGRIRIRDLPDDATPAGEPYPVEGRPEDLASLRALAAFRRITGVSADRAVVRLRQTLADARFVQIEESGAWLWKAGDVLLFVERNAFGEPRVSGVGAVVGSQAERRLREVEPAEDAEASAEPPGAAGRFFVTGYAVRRYIERVAPGLSYEAALAKMIHLTSAGKRVGPAKGANAELWRGPRTGTVARPGRDSRLRFIVADHLPEAGPLRAVITVLPPHGNPPASPH